MSNTHNNGNNNDLERARQAYARLPQEQPPDLLDQAVLNSARRAVDKKPRWMKFSWVHGLTTTAVFVLAFSLVLNQREPVPDFEAGKQTEELELDHPADLGKKRSAGQVVDSLTLQEKEQADARQDSTLRTRMAQPAVAAPEPASAAGEETGTAELKKSNFAQEPRVIESDQTDKDIGEVVPAFQVQAAAMEDALADQAEGKAEAAAGMPVIAEPAGAAVREKAAEAVTDPEIEKKIQAIIELKQSGNPDWEKELASFRKRHPAYPLPDELLN